MKSLFLLINGSTVVFIPEAVNGYDLVTLNLIIIKLPITETIDGIQSTILFNLITRRVIFFHPEVISGDNFVTFSFITWFMVLPITKTVRRHKFITLSLINRLLVLFIAETIDGYIIRINTGYEDSRRQK